MSKQVNVRLSDFHVKVLNSMQQVHEDIGIKVSQADIIEQALEYWLSFEPNMNAAVSEKMNLGFLSDGKSPVTDMQCFDQSQTKSSVEGSLYE